MLSCANMANRPVDRMSGRHSGAREANAAKEVASKEPGVRVFVVYSDAWPAYESRQRAKAMERVRTRLEKLHQRQAAQNRIGLVGGRL